MYLNLYRSTSLKHAGSAPCASSARRRFLGSVRLWASSMNRRSSLLVLLAVVCIALGGAGCSKEAKKSRHLERADRYFKAEDYEKAEIEYINALRLEPANLLATERLGLIAYQQGNAPKALYLLAKAAGQDTNNLDVRLKLGFAYVGLGSFTNARAEATFILARQPTNDDALVLLADTALTPKEIEKVQAILQALRPQAEKAAGYHSALGRLHGRQKNIKAAEAEFRQALALNPKFNVAYGDLGSLYAQSNDLKQAEMCYKTAADLSPWRSFVRVAYASFKAQSGDVAAADRILDEIIQKAPDYLPASVRKAGIALAQTNYAGCATILDKILFKDSNYYEALLLKARLKAAQGEPVQALAILQQTAKVYSAVPQVHYDLAVAQLLNTNTTAAIASLNTATRLNPVYTEAVLLLAELNTRRGEASSSIAALSGFIQKAPEFVQSYLDLANAYRVQHDLDAALGIYQRLAEIFRTNDQAVFRTNALPIFLAGTVLREQNKNAEARQAFEKALLLAPDHLQIIQQLVEMDIADKQYQAAYQRLQRSLANYPQAPFPRMLLASVQLAQGNTNQAEATLEKAIEADPTAQDAYLYLAQILLAANKQTQALDRLKTALSKDASNTKAWMLMGLICDQRKDYSAARDAYEKILALTPRSALVLNNLAYLYSEHLSQPEKAYEYATKAREINPQDAGIADTLGWLLFKRGEYPKALSLLKESAAKLSNIPEVLHHLAMTHYMLGEGDAARAVFMQALQPGKDFLGKAEAERRLGFLNLDVRAASPEMIATLQKRLSEEPGDPVVRSRLAGLYEQQGAFEKAVQEYETALKLNPKAAPIMVKLVQLYGDRLGNAAKALEMAKTARTLAPDDPNLAYLAGRLAYRTGDHKRALSLLQESAQKLGKDPEVMCDLALALYSVGQVAEAETTMKRALEANPNFSRADAAKRFLALSTLYVDPAKAQQALPQIQAILKVDTNNLPALMASGVLREQARDAAGAIQFYEQIMAISPAFSPAVRQLALLYAGNPKDDKRAYDLTVRAREVFRQDAELDRTLGILSYRRGEYPRAVQLLNEVARTRSTDADVFYYLGMAQNQLKVRNASTNALARALALNPKAPWAGEARQALNSPK